MEKLISGNIKKRSVQDRKALLVRTVFIIVGIALWEMLARNNIKIAFYTSFPSAIITNLLEFALSGELFRHAFITLREAYLGLLYGTVAGIVLGVIFSQFPTTGRIFVPVIAAVQGIPQLTLAPLYILWFGIGLKSKVALAALMVFFNVFFATYNAIKNIDQKLIESATLLGAGKTQILWHVVIPTSMPWIMTGVRIGASICMVGAIIGEYIGAAGGLGYMVTYASSFFQIDRVMACIAVLLVIGLLVTTILERVERYLLRWRSETNLTINSGKTAGAN
ncbi:MAG: ABC transporter permease [Clostridia bacterium]|jgi:NitT/TauT family transport system permease protein|nr:ABC transporter permease [Clostridia bacterium]